MKCTACGSPLVDDAVFCPQCGTQVPGAQEREDYVFEAFISYRHTPQDTKAAVALQKALEGFRIPAGLREEAGRARLGKLFRDQDELPTSSSLSDQIQGALQQSRRLVVVCSPRTRESQWVAREVELFASYHGRDKIVVALAEGEPDQSFPELLLSHLERAGEGEGAAAGEGPADEGAAAGEGPVGAGESGGAAGEGAAAGGGPAGAGEAATAAAAASSTAPAPGWKRVASEPIAADVRPGPRAKLKSEHLRVAASLIGCGYDDLRQRQKARTRRMATAAAAAVTAVSVMFGSFSTYQQVQIKENYRQAQVNESEFLATEANQLFSQGERLQAVQVAKAALPQSAAAAASGKDRPFVPAAQLALETALEVYPDGSEWSSCYSVGDCASYRLAVGAGASGGLLATIGAGDQLAVRDLPTGQVVATVDLAALEAQMESELAGDLFGFGHKDSALELAFAGDALLLRWSDVLACVDARTGETRWLLASADPRLAADAADAADDASEDAFAFTYSSRTMGAVASEPAGDTLLVVAECSGSYSSEKGYTQKTYTASLVDAGTGQVQRSFALPDAYDQATGHDHYLFERLAAAFTPDGTRAVVAAGGIVYMLDLATGQAVWEAAGAQNFCQVRCFGDFAVVASTESSLGITGGSYLEAFSYEGRKLWSHRGDVQALFSPEGMDYENVVGAYGLWESSNYSGPQVAALLGNELLLLDADDGAVNFRLEESAPFADCYTQHPSGTATDITACTLGATALWRNPGVADNTGSPFDQQMERADWARFCQTDDGTYLCLWDGGLERVRVYRWTSGEQAAGAVPVEGMADASEIICAGKASLAAVLREQELALLDTDTLEALWAVPYSTFGDLKASYVPHADLGSSGIVYVYGALASAGAGEEDVSVVYRLDREDGSATQMEVAGVDLSESNDALRAYSMGEGAAGGAGEGDVLLLHDTGAIALVDAATGERTAFAERAGRVGAVGYNTALGTKVVACEDARGGADHYAFCLVDLATGEDIPCDLAGYAPLWGYPPAFSISADGARLVAVCSDGVPRLFALPSGDLLWESDAYEGVQHVAFASGEAKGANVFLQDVSGTCILVSGRDGSVLAASSTALPPITYSWEGPGGTLNVQWLKSGMAGISGTSIISVDQDAFGPLTTVPGGFSISADQSHALVHNWRTQEVYSVPLVPLDDLLAQADAAIAGHELTDSERHLYRIAD